jgi:CheY-like chemotaxis protein/anti-sigma regulatory factor (Ser/Thr protein kinase)
LWAVEVDPGELELAVLNLCVNSRDAMPSGGVISIEAKNVTLTTGPVIGDAVRLTVRDTGVGMDDETLARVFEPFFTTKDVGKGSGLGLAQVYAFMTQSKGTVEIASKPGEGASVTLVFPRTAKPVAEEAAEQAKVAAPAANERLRVLLVEDDHDVGAMTSEMLLTLGHAVIHVTSAANALERLEKESVDLVLSDVMMAGGMNGLELARTIRARRPALPIILATGLAESADGAGAEGFELLLKPYELSALQQLIAVSRRQSSA